MAQFKVHFTGRNGGKLERYFYKSGIEVHIDGWDVGVKVVARYNPDTGLDEFDIYSSGGTRAGRMMGFIGTLNQDGFKSSGGGVHQ